jgi:hypothetical protein
MSLYAYLAIHEVARREAPIRNHLNTSATFWNTTLNALVTATLLAFGRVYETNSNHNLATFMRVMRDNQEVFGRAGIRRRKALIFANNPAGLQEYMRGTRVPSPRDWRRVATAVARNRRTYQHVYRRLRDNVFAHTLTVDPATIGAMFAATNIRQMQGMATFLVHLHYAFQGAFQNGGRLTAMRRRRSIAQMLQRPRGQAAVLPPQEIIVRETKLALQPWDAAL